MTNQLKKHEDTNYCYFGGERFLKDRHGEYTEEVAELWSDQLQDTVLAHPDCTPRGIEAILTGEDPDWKMA